MTTITESKGGIPPLELRRRRRTTGRWCGHGDAAGVYGYGRQRRGVVGVVLTGSPLSRLDGAGRAGGQQATRGKCRLALCKTKADYSYLYRWPARLLVCCSLILGSGESDMIFYMAWISSASDLYPYPVFKNSCCCTLALNLGAPFPCAHLHVNIERCCSNNVYFTYASHSVNARSMMKGFRSTTTKAASHAFFAFFAIVRHGAIGCMTAVTQVPVRLQSRGFWRESRNFRQMPSDVKRTMSTVAPEDWLRLYRAWVFQSLFQGCSACCARHECRCCYLARCVKAFKSSCGFLSCSRRSCRSCRSLFRLGCCFYVQDAVAGSTALQDMANMVQQLAAGPLARASNTILVVWECLFF